MDYDLWLRLCTLHPLVRVPRVLAYYHYHGGEQITRNRARIAINHWRAQRKYLRTNPDVIDAPEKSRVRPRNCFSGYASYWKCDLPAAWQVFRQVMRTGYASWHDLKYLLPALLPLGLYQALIGRMDKNHHEQPID
jgi:hypothetical protein